MIACYPETNDLYVVDIVTERVVLRTNDLLLQNVWIDETGCFMAALNRKKDAVDIYVLDWQYHIEDLPKPKLTQLEIEMMLQKQ